MKNIFSLFAIFTVVLFPLKSQGAEKETEEENFHPNSDICGYTVEDPEDIRTFNPWTVSIYGRQDLNSKFKYFVTGSILSPDTVLTVFGGKFGRNPKNDTKYHIPPASHYLVAAGLKSTDLSDVDGFAQLARVSYVAPFFGNISALQNYHVVIFRLLTPFTFNTPYVRPICVPFGVHPVLKSLGYEGGMSELSQSNEDRFYVGGFNQRGNGPDAIFVHAEHITNGLCFDNTTSHLRPQLEPQAEGAFCMKVIPDNRTNSETCISYGSVAASKSNEIMSRAVPSLGPLPRYFVAGPITVIPRKGRGQCNIKSIYFISGIHKYSHWVKQHMRCPPTTFPCRDGTCIPLYKVCDHKRDCIAPKARICLTDPECLTQEDEEATFCNATNRCAGPNMYRCGLEGKCIALELITDGKADCPDGNDEDPELLIFLHKQLTTFTAWQSLADITKSVGNSNLNVSKATTAI